MILISIRLLTQTNFILKEVGVLSIGKGCRGYLALPRNIPRPGLALILALTLRPIHNTHPQFKIL
jgi:hypothetical protein